MISLAYECYADRDVIQFLRVGCRLALQEVHSFSQGEVINAVFVKNIAEVGMVDEDPQSSHHRIRDRLEVTADEQYVQLRRASGKPDRFLIVVKPDLEKCSFASMQRLGLKSKIAAGPSELHRMLGSSAARQHSAFQSELLALNTAARQRGIPVFTTEVEDILRGARPS